MARGDTGKWVARAGATGGGRTYRGHMPVRWYSSLVLICLLGVALITYSRYERQHPAASTPPAIGSHWYQALSFDVCGTLQPNLPANPTTAGAPPGIRTDGDGVIRVAPTTAADAGANATLARFVTLYRGLELTASTLKLPGKAALVNGKACTTGADAGKKGSVQIKVWPSFTGSNTPTIYHDPASVKLADGQLITVAFVPEGASIPKPNSIVALLNDRAASANPSTTTPSVTAPTSPTPTLSPTTAATSTTVAPSKSSATTSTTTK